MMIIMQKYKIIKVLGDGAFGSVVEAVNLKTNEVVAIKKMKQKYKSWQECLQLRQVKSLRKLNHPNITKLKQVLLVNEQLHLVFQYLESNLYEEYSKRKEKGQPYTEQEIKVIMFQIGSALAHMHRNGIFHRDLKPENLLLSGPVAKLCDLGLARQIRSRPPFTDYVSTRWYRAPQLLLRSTNYNSPVDVFAFGCILAQLYNLSPLFPGSNDMDQMSKVVKVLGTPQDSEWPQGYKLAKVLKYNFAMEVGVSLHKLIPSAGEEALELIESCFCFNSRKRLTMLEVLKHPYFKGVHSPLEEETVKKKNIVFAEKQQGEALDLEKQHKKIEQFRTTKQKFRLTRKQDAFLADPMKNLQKSNKRQKVEDPTEDIDTIIRELQQKQIKKKISFKGSMKQTRQKFHTQSQKPRIADSHNLPYNPNKFPVKTQYEDIPKLHGIIHNQGGFQRSGKKPTIFAYNFQPASLPFLAPANPIHQHQKFSPLVNKHKAIGLIPLQSSNKSNRPSKLKSLAPTVLPFHY